VVHKEKLQSGPAGLVFLGELARMIEIDQMARKITSGNPQIAVKDILTRLSDLIPGYGQFVQLF